MRATAWLLAAGLVAVGVPASARTIIVGPHDSIQGAVDQAAPGDTVAVRPGTYHEAGGPCPTEPGNSHRGPGEVVHNVATGSNDTGIYVGQSHDVRVDHNLATRNVSGFELENSSNSRVDHNEATGNTGGILTFTNIFLDVKQNADNRMDHNLVHENNKPNSCLNPADEVCAVPPGTGLLVLAADRNRVDHNVVTGNDSFGIAVANFCVATNLTPEQCAALDIEPNPDFDRVIFNVATGNGTAPSPLINPVFAVDLAWDTTGTDDCWEHNVAGTPLPAEVPTWH